MAERQVFGDKEGVAAGSDFKLEPKLTVHGVTDTSRVTSSGAATITFSDSALNSGVALLTDATGTITTSTGVASFPITVALSSGWEAGFYNGDVKVIDSGTTTLYWPVAMRVREPKD